MRLDQLEQFIHVVDCGSLNKAAQKMYMSPSSLTTSIRSLEGELGYEILRRSNKGIKLTEQGKEVYNRAKRIYAEVVSLKSEVCTSPPKEQLLVLNNYSVRTRDVFLKTYMQYADRAGIMRIKDCPFLQTVSEISQGLSSLGIITIYPFIGQRQLKYLKKHHLEYEKLHDVELFVILGPANPLYMTASEDISLEELREYNFITYMDEDSNALWQEVFLDAPYRMQVFVDSVETMTEIISLTTAYTIETYDIESFRKSLYFRQLRLLRIRNCSTAGEYGIINAQGAVLSPLEQTFLTLLRSEFARKI